MDTQRSAGDVESRVLKILHHDPLSSSLVPGFGIAGVGIKMFPYCFCCCFAGRGCNGIAQHDIAVFLPGTEVRRREHGFACFDCGKKIRGWLRNATVRDRGIDARYAFRRDAAGCGNDPLFECLEAWRFLTKIPRSLLKPQSTCVDHEMVEMEIVRCRRMETAASSGRPARP